MAFPFAHSPILESQLEVSQTIGLHEVAKIMSVAGIAIEDIICVTGV